MAEDPTYAEAPVGARGSNHSARKTLVALAKDNPWSHLVRAASTIVVTPVMIGLVGWLLIDKVNSIDSRIGAHDTKFEKIQDQLGQIVGNQSAGQAQRDAQQKQLDTLETWLQRLVDRMNAKR